LSVTAKELKTYFEEFGTVVKCRIKKDSCTLKSLGCGYIEFEDSCVARALLRSQSKYQKENNVNGMLRVKGMWLILKPTKGVDANSISGSQQSISIGSKHTARTARTAVMSSSSSISTYQRYCNRSDQEYYMIDACNSRYSKCYEDKAESTKSVQYYTHPSVVSVIESSSKPSFLCTDL